MRFQTTIATLLAAATAASAAPASSAEGNCATGETQMCCQNLNENKVGYYCATPNQAFPCYEGSPQLQAMCCTGYDLTPRGYTALECSLWSPSSSSSSSSSAVAASSTAAAATSSTAAATATPTAAPGAPVDCDTNGAIVCIGEKQFGLCNWGKAIPQDLAAGTQCTDGVIRGILY